MSQYDGSLKFDTKLELGEFEKGVTKMQHAAKAALVAIGAAVASAAIAVASFGSEMETSMTKVSTLMDGSASAVSASVGEIQASLLNTSAATGQSAAQLAEAAYQALSAGVAVEKASGFVDKAAKLAIGGFTSTERSVDVLSSVVNAYGDAVMDADKAGKILMQTQNKGKTTIDELSHSLAQVTPTAAAMNVTFEQVGASLATMTAQGVPTSQATTQLNQLFAELGKNGTQASDALAAAARDTEFAGKSFSALMAQGVPLSDLLLLLSDHAQKNGSALLDMFGSIEAGKAALSLVNEAGKTYTQNLTAMSTQADVVGSAYEKMMDTVAAKKDIFLESAKNLAIAAYRYIEQPLKDVTDAGIKSLQKLIKYVQQNGDKIINTLKKLATAAASVAAAFVAFQAITKTAALITALSKAFGTARLSLQLYTMTSATATVAQGVLNGAFTATEVLVGVLTGKVGLCTAAVGLFNAAWAANPIGIVATGIAVLVAGIVALTMAMSDNQSAAKEELAIAQERHAALQQQAADYEQLKAARFESAQADLSSIDYTNQLSQELLTLADSSGMVQEADRARARFLLGELNAALGTEYTMTDGIIGQYDTLRSSVEQLIASKRAEILLSAQEDAYREAITQRAAAQREAADAKIAMDQAQAAADEIAAQHIEELTELEKIRALGADATMEQHRTAGAMQMQSWYQELQTRRETLDEQAAAYQTAQGVVQQYYADIASYEQAAGLIASGETHNAIALMEQKSAAYLGSSAAIAQSAVEQQQILGQQYANQLVQLSDYLAAYNAGMDGYTLEGVAALQEAAVQCGAEAERAGAAIVDGQITGLNGKKIPLQDTIRSLADGAVSIARSKAPEFVPTGRQMAAGVENGIRIGKSGAVNAAVELVRAAIDAANAEADINSPSGETTESGEYLGDGYVVGMKKKVPYVKKEGVRLAQAAIPDTFSAFTTSFSERMRAASIQMQVQALPQTMRAPRPVYDGGDSDAGMPSVYAPHFTLPQALDESELSRKAAEEFQIYNEGWKIL